MAHFLSRVMPESCQWQMEFSLLDSQRLLLTSSRLLRGFMATSLSSLGAQAHYIGLCSLASPCRFVTLAWHTVSDWLPALPQLICQPKKGHMTWWFLAWRQSAAAASCILTYVDLWTWPGLYSRTQHCLYISEHLRQQHSCRGKTARGA